MNDALLEFSQLKTEYTEQEAQLATEQHSYNQESAAFMQEMEMCHSEQSQCHEAQSELRNFQRLFRLDAVTDKTWPMVKNWQAWMGHYSSELSHKLKKEHSNWIPVKSRAAPQNQFYHCWHCGLKCYLGLSCMNYKCSMNKIMEQEKKLQEENTMKLKEELTEALAEAQAAQSPAIAPSNNDLINRLREEVLAAEETNSKQDSYVRNLSEQKQHMETEAQEYSKHIVDYVKEIAELKKTKEDLEIAREEAYSSIAEQNEMVKEMVLKESRKMAELHQQNQQVLTLKKIVMDNRKIQETQEKEVQDLRDHLQAMQERMAALGIEDMHEKKIQEENDKELATAIHISEQLAAAGQGSKQPTTPPLPPPATPPPPSPTAPSPSAKAVPSPKAEPSPKAPASERQSERADDDDNDPDNLD